MKPYAKITLIYFLLGIIWILASDLLVFSFFADPDEITRAQTLKGWLYVLLSSGLLYLLCRSAFRRQQDAENEKKKVYRKTVEGSCHILLNYMNQMQLITLEADRCPDFDRSLLFKAEQISQEVSEELKTLEQLDIVSADDIETFVYRKLRP